MNLASHAVDKILGTKPTATPTQADVDTSRTMKALVWEGKKDVRVEDKPVPILTDPRDIILKVTATTVCGSDFHMYSGNMPGMYAGDILGHEFMGIVQDVGSEVQSIKKGMRVVVSFDIACGSCSYCKREEFTACDRTNNSKQMETMYGHATAGIFGYSHLTGGVAGGQAEYVRVPFADTNCLPIPENVPDVQALYLSDIVPTAYHAMVMGQVKEGDTVAIWGLGPVGLLTARWCQLQGARKIIGIDCVPERLALAKTHLRIDTIDYNECKVYDTIMSIVPGGVDVAIEAAGFEYAKTLLHKVERAIGLETDTADILAECIQCVRKYGRVSIIGVYAGYCNHFPIGALMEKGLMMMGGQSPTQKYWKMALSKIMSGEFDPTFVVTHKVRLADLPEVYSKSFERKEGMIKVFAAP